MIITSDYGPFPHSLRLAPVRKSVANKPEESDGQASRCPILQALPGVPARGPVASVGRTGPRSLHRKGERWLRSVVAHPTVVYNPSGLSLLIPLITWVVTQLLSGMSYKAA